MAKNTGKGHRVGAVSGRTQVKNTRTGSWTKRDAYTGRFVATKKSGGTFKGVRKEK